MAKRQTKTEQPAVAEEEFDEAMTDEERAYFEAGGEDEAEAEQEAGGEQEASPEQEQAEEPTAEEAEAQAEAAAADAEGGERQKTVPHQAFHQEREERKRFQSELQREREERMADRARFEERFKAIQDRLQPQQQDAQPEPPDPNEDPMGALAWTQAQMRQLAEERQKTEQQTAQQQQANQEWERQYNEAVTEWQGFVQENPQANEAYNHLLESRYKEYLAHGLNQMQAAQRLRHDEAQTIRYARANGIPISNLVVGMAQARGWAPKPAQEPAQQDQQQAQEQPQTQKQPDAAKAIATAQRGQNAARTLSGGGGSPDGPLSLEALLEMDETEFGKAVAKLSPSEERRIFGG